MSESFMNKKLFIILLFISGWLIIASAIQGKIALPSSKLATPLILAQNDEFETDNLADQTKSELNGSPRRISKSKAVLLSLLATSPFAPMENGRKTIISDTQLDTPVLILPGKTMSIIRT
jgi:hypothetical protein